VLQGPPAVLEFGCSAFAEGADASDQAVGGSRDRVQVLLGPDFGTADRDEDTDPGADVALPGREGGPGTADDHRLPPLGSGLDGWTAEGGDAHVGAPAKGQRVLAADRAGPQLALGIHLYVYQILREHGQAGERARPGTGRAPAPPRIRRGPVRTRDLLVRSLDFGTVVVRDS
jgi:hypothetical protein